MGEHQRCDSCGVTVFHNPHPAVAAIPVHDGQVLLARRAIEPAKGLIDTFGGFLEWGENPLDALVREFAEETGGAIFTPRCITGAYHHYYPWGGLNVSVVVIMYLGAAEGQIHPTDDVSEALWCPLDALTDLTWSSPQLLDAMKDLQVAIARKNR